MRWTNVNYWSHKWCVLNPKPYNLKSFEYRKYDEPGHPPPHPGVGYDSVEEECIM